jgi:4-hydroxy-tetrahydrodipicolinate synthase
MHPMTEKLVQGVYAALLTPRLADDSVDEAAFIRLLEFLIARGISSFALNGATGEFCLTEPRHLRILLSVAHGVCGNPKILCGIGAAGAAGSIELGKIAAGEGAQAVLLPMPYFFPYEQEDLEAFVHTVASSVPLPILLYNLPSFTSQLDPETSCRLIRDVPNVVGIKDSGESTATLRLLTNRQIPACRLVGNDGVLVETLRERVCDGVVSGVACVIPELIRAIFDEREDTSSAQFTQLSELLDEFRDQLSRAPVPWALKWIAEARGICTAAFSQPLAEVRRQQGRELIEWFRQWQTGLSSIRIPVA